jgi:hypothetical protein
MYKMFLENHRMYLWNQKDKLIVSVMSNCLNVENTKFSRTILNELWLKEITNAAVLFLKPNDPTDKDLEKTQLIQHKTRTSNCTLCIPMRIRIDAIQVKAIYW